MLGLPLMARIEVVDSCDPGSNKHSSNVHAYIRARSSGLTARVPQTNTVALGHHCELMSLALRHLFFHAFTKVVEFRFANDMQID